MPIRLCSPRGVGCRCHRCPLCDDRLLFQSNDPQTIRPLRLRWSSNELSEPNLWRLRSNLTNFVTRRLCHLRSLTKSSWPSDGGWPMLDTINTVRTILKNSRNPAKAVYDDHDLCLRPRNVRQRRRRSPREAGSYSHTTQEIGAEGTREMAGCRRPVLGLTERVDKGMEFTLQCTM